MKKMGWKDGEGLGKDGDGQQTHIQIKRRVENEGMYCFLSIWCFIGLGLDESDRTNQTFISTIGNFSEVLEGLNKEHAGKSLWRALSVDVIKQMKKMEKKDKKRKEKKDKKKKKKDSSKITTRHKWALCIFHVHRYKKILENKTISNYSTDDLNAILGISPRDESFVCFWQTKEKQEQNKIEW